MLNNIDTIIFDLDGTLVDSMRVWRDIDIEYLESFGIPFPDDLQKSLEGMNFRDTAIYIKNRFGIQDDIDSIISTWNNMALKKYKYEVPLKDGVKDYLDYVKSKGIRLGIATTNSRLLSKACLEANNIYDYFDCIVTGEDITYSKPNPEIYKKALSLLKADSSSGLVFEDTLAGLKAGKEAGMKICAVDDCNSIYCRSEKKDISDYFIFSYKDILPRQEEL